MALIFWGPGDEWLDTLIHKYICSCAYLTLVIAAWLTIYSDCDDDDDDNITMVFGISATFFFLSIVIAGLDPCLSMTPGSDR